MHEYVREMVKIGGHYGILIPLKHVYHNKKLSLNGYSFMHVCIYTVYIHCIHCKGIEMNKSIENNEK